MKNLTSRPALLVALTAFLLPTLVGAKTTIKGKISDGEGNPPILAHVHLFPLDGDFGTKPLKTVEVGSDGSYKLTIDDPGYYRVAVTAVDHDYVSVPVIVGKDDAMMKLDIAPAFLRYNRAPEELQIIGSWNDFDFAKAESMTGEKDGSFSYTVKTVRHSISYQILNLVETSNGGMRSVNVPGSAKYVYDGGGDYRSVINVKPGKVTIRFNPADLPARDVGYEPMVQFDDPVHAQLREIDYAYRTTNDQFMYAAMKARAEESDISPAEIWMPFVQIAEEFMAKEHPETVRQFAALNLARIIRYVRTPEHPVASDETMAMLKSLLPADAEIWSVEPGMASTIVSFGDESKTEAVLELVEKNPDRKVRAIALSHLVMIHDGKGEKRKAKKYYEMLEDDFSDIEEVAYVLTQYDPDRRVQTGREVPDFEVTRMGSAETGSSAGVVSKASMKGKYYLIDFWATWCGPCIGELPSLHKAYERFRGENFEVLSLSFDAAPDNVKIFRETKWEMPWLHAFVDGSFNSDLAKRFEVMGIPKPVLVDPNGVIVAVESDLRGAALEKTLERFLGDGQVAR